MKHKTILLLVSILLLTVKLLHSEVPNSINYQGRYFVNGEPVTGTKNNCYFKITNFDGSTVYYSTGPLTIQFKNGLFNWQIPCSTVPWNNPPSGGYYLEVTIDGTPIGREKILAVPYAFFASSASYATTSATGGGWVDEGDIVRLETALDNVGIGTTTLNGKLSVYGTGTYWSLFVSTSTDGSTKNFVIKKDGFVGIGCEPSAPFHVNLLQDYGTGLSIDAQGTTGGRQWTLISTGDQATEGQGKLLIKDDTQQVVRMTIDTGGNVGIGTTAPSGKLHVRSTDTYSCAMRVDNPSGTSIVYVSTTGNVGIGTTAPATKLHIEGDTQFGSTTASTFSVSGYLDFVDLTADPAGASGRVAFRSDTGKLRLYTSGVWVDIATGTIPAGGLISGSGTTNKVARFTGTNTIGNSSITDEVSTVTVNANLRLGGNGTIYNVNGSTKIWLGDTENIRFYSGSTGWFVFHDKNRNEVFKIDGTDYPGSTYIYNNLSIHNPGSPYTQRFKVWGAGGVRVGLTDADPGANNLIVDNQIGLYNLTDKTTYYISNDNTVGAIKISSDVYLSGSNAKIGNAHFFTSGFPNDQTDGVPWYGLGRRSSIVDPMLGNYPPVQLSGWSGLLFKTSGGEVGITQWGRVGISTTAPLGALHIKATGDQLILQDSDGPTADENLWVLKADSGKLELLTANDAWSSWNAGLRLYRSGTGISKVEVPDGCLSVPAAGGIMVGSGTNVSTFSAYGYIDFADLTADPAGAPGRVAFRSDTGKLRLYTSGVWVDIATGTIPAGGLVSGSGTANKVAKFTGSTTIGDSNISDNGTYIVLQGTSTGAGVNQGAVYINNNNDTTGRTILGLATRDTQKFRFDNDGDLEAEGHFVNKGKMRVGGTDYSAPTEKLEIMGTGTNYSFMVSTASDATGRVFTVTNAGNVIVGRPGTTVTGLSVKDNIYSEGYIRTVSYLRVDGGLAGKGVIYSQGTDATSNRYIVLGNDTSVATTTTTICGDLRTNGNDILDSGGNTRITFATAGDNVTLTGQTKVSGQLIVTGSATVQGAGGLGVNYGVTAGTLTLTAGAEYDHISSISNLKIKLDYDGNEDPTSFVIQDNAGNERFTVNEWGEVTLKGNQTIKDSGGITRIGLATSGDNVTLSGQTKVSGQLIVTGSVTVQGAGGAGVTYGISAGSVTITSGKLFTPTSLYLYLDSDNNETTALTIRDSGGYEKVRFDEDGKIFPGFYTATPQDAVKEERYIDCDNSLGAIHVSTHTKVSGQLIVVGSATVQGNGLWVNNGITLSGAQDIKNYIDSSRTMIAGGTAWNTGGIFQIFGKDASGDAGPGGAQLQLWNNSSSKFEIYAYNDWTRRFRVWGMGGVRVGSTNVDPGPNNLAVDGSVTVYGSALEVGSGSSGGDALKIVNGGDLRIYNSDNSGSVAMYCDNASTLTVSGDLQTTGAVRAAYGAVTCVPLYVGGAVTYDVGTNSAGTDRFFAMFTPAAFHQYKRVEIKAIVYLANATGSGNGFQIYVHDSNDNRSLVINNADFVWDQVGTSTRYMVVSEWKTWNSPDNNAEIRLHSWTDASSTHSIREAYVLVRPVYQ